MTHEKQIELWSSLKLIRLPPNDPCNPHTTVHTRLQNERILKLSTKTWKVNPSAARANEITTLPSSHDYQNWAQSLFSQNINAQIILFTKNDRNPWKRIAIQLILDTTARIYESFSVVTVVTMKHHCLFYLATWHGKDHKEEGLIYSHKRLETQWTESNNSYTFVFY